MHSTRNPNFGLRHTVVCRLREQPLPLRDIVARAFDGISAGDGNGAGLVAEAGLMITLPLHNCEPPNKHRCQPERTLPPRQGLENRI
jgi:hypothetical protein